MLRNGWMINIGVPAERCLAIRINERGNQLARVEMRWFTQVFQQLRENERASRHLGGPLSFPESSHLVGMLVKADLVAVVGQNPIQISVTSSFQNKNDEALVNKLKNVLSEGVKFSTPVKKAESQITGWTFNSMGDEVVGYRMLGSNTYERDAEDEVERTKHQAEISRRPGQTEFSERIRRNYGGRCAITGCKTAAALQAAHVRTIDGADLNASENGILLRSDIHALLDAFQITFEAGGAKLKKSRYLTDKTYAFLDGAKIRKPIEGGQLSHQSITDHRKRFEAAECKKQSRK
ncbi:HNH endonuclease [Novacetimonas hansenii]|uniref:HNH endonuclease n=1 Tax=Novacetimonas hansenii TaxID=436 RepID=UPI00248E5CB2|nr:HNH endonuclease signature motif containing protein [Novacetimonas hansenii]